MSKIALYDTENITVEYWPDKRFIYHTIHQPMSTHLPEFKEALDIGTAALEQYKLCKWLSDDRKNDQLTKEGSEWAFLDWQPRTMKAGWKYWASVVPQDVVAAGTLASVIDQLFERGLRMLLFSDVEQAMAWLDKIPEPTA